LNYARVIFCFQ